MHPLDNVIWQALSTKQAHLAERNGSAAKFQKEVSILGALAEPTEEAYQSLASLLHAGDRIGLFLESDPQPRDGWRVLSSVPLLQMMADGDAISYDQGEQPGIVALGEKDVPEMIALTELTRPGPFGRRTREMGDYFGIRQQGNLIAMAGERLRLPGYTEISAVCTHPDHLGRGYARTLMVMLMDRIRLRGEVPFLHVRPENERAVALYRRLGFTERLMRRYVILVEDA